MEPSPLEPWPDALPCGACGKPGTVSYFDEKTMQTVNEHQDGSESCRREGASPATRHPDGRVTFAIKTHAEFLDWPKAEDWGKFVAGRLGGPFYLGYGHGSGGHRVIGRVEDPDDACVVFDTAQGTVVKKEGPRAK